MLGRTGVAPYGRRCSWAHSEGHIGVAHYGILVGGPFQLRWQPIGRRCLWAYLGEVPTQPPLEKCNLFYSPRVLLNMRATQEWFGSFLSMITVSPRKSLIEILMITNQGY